MSFVHSHTIVLANKGRLVIHRDMSSENICIHTEENPATNPTISVHKFLSFVVRRGGGLNHVSEPERLERSGPCLLLKLRRMVTQRVQMKGVLPWLDVRGLLVPVQ